MYKSKLINLKSLTSTFALLVGVSSAQADPGFQITVKKPGEEKSVERQVKISNTKPLVSPTQESEVENNDPGIDYTTTASVTAAGNPESEPSRSNTVSAKPIMARKDISIRTVFDVFDAKPVLNVHHVKFESGVVRGQPYTVRGLWNYSAFIKQAEVRVFESGASANSQPLMVLPTNEYREASIPTSGADIPDTLNYILRVYDGDGRYDETQPRTFSIVENTHEIPATSIDFKPITTLEQVEDRAAKRLIEVEGGGVVVRGSNLESDEEVAVLHTKIRVSDSGDFEAHEILPYGEYDIPVEVFGPRAKLVERSMYIPESEWFYVGHLDVSAGPGISERAHVQSNDIDVIGRAGFYAKGKIKGGYKVTAAIDTQEDEARYLLSNVTRRSGTGLINEVEVERLFPNYGDSSSIENDAPTQSNLFVRIENGEDQLVVGSYDVNVQGSDILDLDRGLYGAKAEHRSKEITIRGERRTEVIAYAAHLDTLASYELLAGTGGTVFRLSRQDVLEGSVRLQIEIRNKTTNVIVSKLELQEGRDYSIDHLQGRIILVKPLINSLQNSNSTVGVDDDIYLAARYEYVPAASDVDGYSYAGRATHWLNDDIRVGVTANTEQTDTSTRTAVAGDVLFRMGESSWLKGAYGQSEGPSNSLNGTIDGGISYVTPPAFSPNARADAWRTEGYFDFTDLHGMEDDIDRIIGFYAEHYDAGYSGKARLSANESDAWGVYVNVGTKDVHYLTAQYDESDVAGEGRKRLASGKFTAKLNEEWTGHIGLTYDWVSQGSTFSAIGLPSSLNRFGSRTDGLIRFDRELSENRTFYLFGQTTLDRNGNRLRNDRAGLGFNHMFSEEFETGGEISYGTNGVNLGLEFTQQKQDAGEVTLGYTFVNDPRYQAEIGGISRTQSHAFKIRGNRKINDTTSVFTEASYGLTERFGLEDSTNSLGIEYRPEGNWWFDALVDASILDQSTSGEYRRKGFSGSANYADERLKLSVGLEARIDRGLSRDADFWAARVSSAYSMNDDWIFQTSLDTSFSDGKNASLLDSKYMKAVIAGVYRPIENDELNAIIRYKYLGDLSPAGQTGAGGISNVPMQKSHVLNADTNWDINDQVTLGVKYAVRSSEVSLSRNSANFVKNTAQLGVLRGDYKISDKWELMVEGRILDISDADRKSGILAGSWYYLNDKVKIGGGYSWSEFSSDITDLSEDNEGWFINVGAAF